MCICAYIPVWVMHDDLCLRSCCDMRINPMSSLPAHLPVDERRKENKSVLNQQSRQLHKLNATLASQQAQHSRSASHVTSHVTSMLQRARTAESAADAIRMRAETLRKADEVEVSKVV